LTNWRNNSLKSECNSKRARSYTYTEIINYTDAGWEEQMRLLVFFTAKQQKRPSPNTSVEKDNFILLCSSLLCI